MGRQIELPPSMNGDEQQQLQTLYSYLYQTAEALNINLAEIGGSDLTDQEMEIVKKISGDTSTKWKAGAAESETLKSLIIKTAEFVSNTVNEFRLNLLGEYVADGKFGKYVRKTGLDVDITPTGIQQNYSLQEIIQGLKTYEINAKNYIKTGLLRTVGGLPVYGVAIGKDVVQFLNDGTEVYRDENKVAELTADELSFWQNNVKIASYTGTNIAMYSGNSSRISFYNGANEVFYIDSGELYSAGDLEIGSGKKIKIGNWTLTGNGIYGENTVSNRKYEMALRFNSSNGEIRYIDEYGEGGSFKFKIGGNPTKPIPTSCGEFESEVIDTDYLFADTVSATNYITRSSREIKHDIQDIKSDGDRIDRLRPVTFVYNGDPFERTHCGMIHEEAAEIMPEICTGIGKEKPEDRGINYIELIPILLKEIQELRKRVKALEER